MRRFPVFVLLAMLLAPVTSLAQEKLLTIEDAVVGQWRELYPERMQQLSWKADTDVYTFVEEQTLYQSSPDAPDAKEELFSLSELNTALTEAGLDEMSRIPRHQWKDQNKLAFQSGNAFVLFDVQTKQIETHLAVAGEAVNLDKHEHTGNIAYTVENNLFIQARNGEVLTITDEKDPEIVNGQEVHRREFGINTGTFWSPAGNALAFYRKDETMVTDYPLVDVTARVAELNNIKYPMAGMASHHVTVGVYQMETGKTLFLKTGTPKEQYLTNVTWGPGGEYIYIAVLNREQNHMRMNKYSAKTGEFVKTLFEETRNTYVEPSHPLTFLKSDPEKFLYQTRRDGYNHVYLYSTDGELKQQLTSGNWEVTGVLGMDPKERYLYIAGTAVSPTERHVYKVSLRNGKRTRITQAAGTHRAQLSASGKYLLDTYSSIEVPNKVELLTTKGKQVATLLEAQNPLTDFNMPEMTMGTIKAADEATDLYYRLIKPANFDPNKKYPAIMYVYGGPHAQLVTNSWLGGARMWQYYMAQKGYVMLTVD
ncbi:MAG: S9 family peptidase, partial [Bacteroidota bacterium]